MRPRRLLGAVAAGVMALVLLTACGGSDDGGCPETRADTGSTSALAVDPGTLALDASGRHLVAACFEGTCRWDTRSGAYAVADPHRYVAVSPDLTIFARHEHCRPLMLESPGRAPRALHGIDDRLVVEGSVAEDVAFSPDGTMVAAVDGGRHVLVWSASTGRLRSQSTHAGAGGLAFDRDGSRLAVATGHGIVLVDPASGDTLGRLPGSARSTAAWSPDGRWVAAAAPDGRARVWRTSDLSVADTLTGHPFSALAFAPDSRALAVTDDDYPGVNVWTPQALGGSGSLHVLPAPEHPQDGAVFSPDGTRLYTASYDAGVIAWDLRSGRPVPGFENPDVNWGSTSRGTPRPT